MTAQTLTTSKVIDVQDAAHLIKDGDTLATAGFIGIGFAEYLASAIERRFLETGHPKDLGLFYAAGQGDGGYKGLNRFGHEGMTRRVIGGHWGLAPKLGELATQNKLCGYNLPQGIIAHMFRDMAAGKPGTLSKVGLHTFVDPRQEGGKLNPEVGEDIVELMQIHGEDYLFYKAQHLDVALLRGTTADALGNITMEREALPVEALAIAQAVKNKGGKVIVQVERVTDQHQLPPSAVRIPGILVDHVVVSPPEFHMQTFAEAYNPAYTGETRPIDRVIEPLPLDIRKVISRRALLSLTKGAVVNLGIGMPEGIVSVAQEEGRLEEFTLTVEPGGIGGQPASGLSFGAVSHAHAIIDQPAQFDFYDGGGLDQAFLGLAEVGPTGDVNVSRFGSKLAGAGGFINISQNTQDLYFMGTFLSGKQTIHVTDKGLEIVEEGSIGKFKSQVQQITFNGEYAHQLGQRVTYITERAVFELGANGLTLTEIAPGVDLQTQVLDLMEFKPEVSENLKLMDARLFQPDAMVSFESHSHPQGTSDNTSTRSQNSTQTIPC